MYKYKSLQAGQLPQEHLSFLQNLLNFIITKYLKQEVDDNLSVCVDERNLCVTGDKKIYQYQWTLLPPIGIELSQGVVFTDQIW